MMTVSELPREQSPRNRPDAGDSTATPIPPAPRRRSIVARLAGWLAALLALAGGGWWFASAQGILHDDRATLPPAPESIVADRDVVAVTVAPITPRTVRRTLEVVGTLYPFEETVISARVEGRVNRILHDVADHVSAAEILLEIDPTDHELALQQAERALQVELARLGLAELPGENVDLVKIPTVAQAKARLENAELRLERAHRLVAAKAASTEQLENAEWEQRSASAEQANQILLAQAGLATIQMRQTAVAVARKNVQYTQVRAPTPTLKVPGRAGPVTYAITRRNVSEGTLVRPGTEVYTLVIDDVLKLRVPVAERHSAEVKTGQTASITVSSHERAFEGVVTRINPAVDVATRTFEVEILVSNDDRALKAGGFAKASIFLREDAGAPTAPLESIVTFAGVTKIFVVENERCRSVPVTLGVQSTDWIEIVEPPLPPDAQIVTSGQSALADDSPVVVRQTGDASAEAK